MMMTDWREHLDMTSLDSRDSQRKQSTNMKDRRILEEGDWEFGIENGMYVVTHKHKVEDCHYPYTMITIRYYHHKRKTCLECKKPLPKNLLFLRELMQDE